MRLETLYRDEHLVAVNKPSGLLVHRSALDRHTRDNAVDLLQTQLQQSLFPVHRLDKPTSGVLLFALSSTIARDLAAQFDAREITKTYLAVVRGYSPLQGTIDNPVKDKDQPHKPKKDASTRFETLQQIELPVRVDRYPTSRYSLVKLQPLTGRRHQLRLHMKHIGHPILGDTSYGKSLHNRLFASRYDCTRLLLHARVLSITHPTNGRPLKLVAPASDPQFERVLSDAGWRETTSEPG
jgi:tRNA pseudouridine65 synthase